MVLITLLKQWILRQTICRLLGHEERVTSIFPEKTIAIWFCRKCGFCFYFGRPENIEDVEMANTFNSLLYEESRGLGSPEDYIDIRFIK